MGRQLQRRRRGQQRERAIGERARPRRAMVRQRRGDGQLVGVRRRPQRQVALGQRQRAAACVRSFAASAPSTSPARAPAYSGSSLAATSGRNSAAALHVHPRVMCVGRR
jgi:hypothetical protein